MIIWGGNADRYHDLGGRYRPSTDAWGSITAESAPAPRRNHSAVWTGREMIVWGGANETANLGDGAAYDPGADQWRPLAPSPLEPRNLHTAV
jgi:hypothetical protein